MLLVYCKKEIWSITALKILWNKFRNQLLKRELHLLAGSAFLLDKKIK